MSVAVSRLLSMDMISVLTMVGALVVGLVLGAVLATLLGRGRQQTVVTESGAEARAVVAEARAETAQARMEAAQAQAEAAEVSARMARAEAERDAARQRVQEIAADRDGLVNQFQVLSSATLEEHSKKADASAEARFRATELLMQPVRDSIDKFHTRLTEVEKERVEMTIDLRAQVRAVRDTGESLRRETAALATALRKPQVRGSWGETQLKRVAELAGMLERCDFDLQHTTTADDRVMRPDMKVHLAEGRHLFVDSKAPLAAFLDANATDDPQERDRLLEVYARNVRTHVDQLSSKQYWKAAETPEFVVLFLPNEMFFATALDKQPDLYDYAAARDVVIATPTTLIGMLRAVAYGWKQAALAESAAEVFTLGRDLHEKLGLMGSRLDKVGRSLRTSVTAYNELIATVEGTVLVRARRFRDLKVSEAELRELTAVDDPVRQVQAQELIEGPGWGEDPSPVEGPGPVEGVEPGAESHLTGASEDVPPEGAAANQDRIELPELGELIRPTPDIEELSGPPPTLVALSDLSDADRDAAARSATG